MQYLTTTLHMKLTVRPWPSVQVAADHLTDCSGGQTRPAADKEREVYAHDGPTRQKMLPLNEPGKRKRSKSLK